MSATAACRHVLEQARTPSGRPLPITSADMAIELARLGFVLSPADVEALLRQIAEVGDAVEIDEAAGFRWNPRAA